MKTCSRHLALTVGSAGADQGFFWAVIEAGRDAAGVPSEVEIAQACGFASYGEALREGNQAWRRLTDSAARRNRAPAWWARLGGLRRARQAALPVSMARAPGPFRLPAPRPVAG
jgi:hypothetical protein